MSLETNAVEHRKDLNNFSTEEFISYLRRVAADHRESGKELTAVDYEAAAERLEAWVGAFGQEGDDLMPGL